MSIIKGLGRIYQQAGIDVYSSFSFAMNFLRFTGHQVGDVIKFIGGSKNMKGKKRQFIQESKKEAVEHSLASEKSMEKVAQDLGISPHNLGRWRTQYRKRGKLDFPGNDKENLTPQGRKTEDKKSFKISK